jgi:rod shape-determining protein MreC
VSAALFIYLFYLRGGGNLKFLSKNKKIISLFLVTIILIWSITATSKPREKISFAERGFGYILVPVQEFFNYINQKTIDVYSFFAEIGTDKTEKEALKQKIQALEYQTMQLDELKRENQRLQAMVGLKDYYKELSFTPAKVIGRNPDNWDNILIIDKGYRDGIIVNQQVVSLNNGLVGKIIEVGPSWSKVLLLTDVESSVSSLIDRTRDFAIAKGDLAASKSGYIKLSFILPDAEVLTGDTVVTSGMGGIFTKGILIGKVVEVKQEPGNITKYAYIEPTADFKRLEDVMVVNTQETIQNTIKK